MKEIFGGILRFIGWLVGFFGALGFGAFIIGGARDILTPGDISFGKIFLWLLLCGIGLFLVMMALTGWASTIIGSWLHDLVCDHVPNEWEIREDNRSGLSPTVYVKHPPYRSSETKTVIIREAGSFKTREYEITTKK